MIETIIIKRKGIKMKSQNLSKLKNMKKTIIQLFSYSVIMLLSMSAMAQNPYIVYKYGDNYAAWHNEIPLGMPGTLQSMIELIREKAAGADCIIQFGRTDDEVVDLGGGNTTRIIFENIASQTWGKITLTGKAISACTANNGIIRLRTPVSMECKAELTVTGTGAVTVFIYHDSNGMLKISGGMISARKAVVNNSTSGAIEISGGIVSSHVTEGETVCNYSTGTVAISGGIVLATGADGTAFRNDVGTAVISGGIVSATTGRAIDNSEGTVIITGGLVQATDGFAIWNYSTGKINISGTAKITSANESEDYGTIYLANGGTTSTDCRLEITGGTIDNTVTYGGVVIYNASFGEIKISGGTVEAKGEYGDAIFNESAGTVNISDGTVEAKGYNGDAITNWTTGTVNITGGTVEGSRMAIRNRATGVINITGGTVKSINNIAVANSYTGKINISGTAKVTSAYGNADYGTIWIQAYTESTACRLEITGGTIENTATGGNAILNNSTGEVKISGGMILAKEGYAISNTGTGTANISGGIAFAYGKKTDDVITGVTQLDNAVIIAWNKTTTTYEAYTDKDIFKNPTAATAVWTKQADIGGIMVSYNTTAGFIPVEGVTITGVGINETDNDDVVRIYPNPTNGEIRFEISDMRYEILEIEIFDVFGRNIVSNLKSQISNQKIDISHLPTGVYFVKITTDNGIVTKKIVKQ